MALHKCPSLLIVALTIVVIMVQTEQSSAKQRSYGLFRLSPFKKTPRSLRTGGGCSSFGHSCFGGHGKRADEEVVLLPGIDSEQQQRLVFPPSGGAQEDSEDMMQARQQLSSASALSSPHQQYNLSPFLRQWLQSYRRSGDIEVK